jgi:hypothetical protein
VVGEALGLDHVVGAELGHPVAQVRVAHAGGDVGAGRRAELDAGGADPAGGALHEQALAGPQARLGEERVVGGGEDLRHAAGLREAQAVGDGHELALVHDGQLGLPAAADDRHHAVALGEALGSGPARRDLAGELEPGDVLRRPGRGRVAARALVDVGTVEPGRMHADEDLAGPWLGVRVLGHDDLSVADGGGAHGRGV